MVLFMVMVMVVFGAGIKLKLIQSMINSEEIVFNCAPKRLAVEQ